MNESETEIFDEVIHSGVIVTANDNFDIFDDGMIGIRDGKIAAFFESYDAEIIRKAGKVTNAGGGFVLPGLVNTHTHAPMTLFRGMADDLPLQEWLNDHIFPAEATRLNPDSVREGTRIACEEMRTGGISTFCDGYFFEDAVAEAVLDSGLYAVLGHGVIDFPAPGVPDPSKNVKAAADFVDRWMDVSPLIKPSIFCHSPYTCSAETLVKAKNAARDRGVLFQIHVAETKTEWDLIMADYGKTPVAYLNDLGILDGDTLMVHCVWVNDRDIDIIAKSGAGISHNPESNMKLASGVAPVPDFIKAGITVGLGTDGCASNNNQDLFREMETCLKLHRVFRKDMGAMDWETVLKMGTVWGGRAIGFTNQTDFINMKTRNAQPYIRSYPF